MAFDSSDMSDLALYPIGRAIMNAPTSLPTHPSGYAAQVQASTFYQSRAILRYVVHRAR